MKKKIILLLSMCALFVCVFVVSASASEYDYIVAYDYKTSQSVSEAYCVYYTDPVTEERIYLPVLKMSNFEGINWAVQPIMFRNFIDKLAGRTNLTIDEIFDLLNSLNYDYLEDDIDFIHSFICGYGITFEYINRLYNYKAPPTEEDLTAKYTEGYTAGIEDFKDSQAYEDELLLEYNTGLVDGKNKYIASNEYEAALKAEYDNGYEAAENKNSGTSGMNWLIAALILIVPGGIALLIVSHFKKKKRRK